MRLKLTEAMLRKLDQQRTYLTFDGSRRWRAGEEIDIEPDAAVEGYVVLATGHDLPSIGCFSYSWSHLPCPTKIGRYCSISWNVTVINHTRHPLDFASTSSFTYDENFVIFKQAFEDFGVTDFTRYPAPPDRPNRHQPPVIGHDVWIGHHVTLARGITLGHGCAIGAHAVVTKSVPPYAVMGGNPARIIKMRFSEPVIERLLATAWWQYKFTDFAAMRYDNPGLFLDQLEERVASQTIAPYSPAPLRVSDLVALE